MFLLFEKMREQWSKTYNSAGKPEWEHIFGYYDDTIIFHDSIQQVEGKIAFEAMCKRLTKRCKSLKMDIHDIAQQDNIVMMEWTMTMAFRFFPEKAIYGVSKFTFNEQGLISHQRDYYDIWGDIYDGIPGFRRIYRWFMRKFFG